MPRTRFYPILFLAVSLLAILPEYCVAQGRSVMHQDRKMAEREVLVRFREVSPTSLTLIAQTHDLGLIQRLGGVKHLYRLRSRSREVAELVAELSARADVLYAEPNFEVRAIELPNDPLFISQWALQNIGQSSSGFAAGTPGADISAVPAWDISTGSSAHVVGIVDTGIDYTHPDLQGNIWSAPTDFTIVLNGVPVTCSAGTHGYNAITGACDPMDDHMHGTHVSGIIGASGNNNIGIAGVNWTTQMMGLKFLTAGGYGYASDAVTAMEFAIQVKKFFAPSGGADVRIFSNSWGGGGFSQALQDEIDEASANDILFVAAAGNNASDNDLFPFYPASFARPNMIVVAATDNNDALASFSNYGAQSVQLGAPGVDILSTLLGGTYGYLSGTSMATPHVSGAAALVLSICPLNTAGLKQDLLDNVDALSTLSGVTSTGGRLNIYHALLSCRGAVSLSPIELTLGSVVLGQSSDPKIITLTNNQTSPLNLTAIQATGDFSQTNNCSSTLEPNASCAISVIFKPSFAGPDTGQLQVFDDAAGSPQQATLIGSGAQIIPIITWATPSAINYGTPLSATQLDATANVPGTFVYTPPAGTILSVGNHMLSVTFTPLDSLHYTTQTANTTLLVNPAPPAPAPTFAPAAGTYYVPQTVTLSDTATGVTIYYTTDGTFPTASSNSCTNPCTIQISTTTTLRAMASGNGYSQSSTAVTSYTITALAPTFSPGSGAYYAAMTVTVSDATTIPGVLVYYTTNGTLPTTSSSPCTSPCSIPISGTTTLRAMAAGNGISPSATTVATYTIAANNPTFSPSSGSYYTPPTVTINETTPGTTIYYTVNGTFPTTSSTICTSPCTVSPPITGNTMIRAMALGNAISQSGTSVAVYWITAYNPTFSLASGTYTGAQQVTITDTTTAPGLLIYYTTNGAIPTTTNSISCASPCTITVSASSMIKAMATAPNITQSGVAVASYTIQ